MIQSSVIRDNDGARYLSILLKQMKLFWKNEKFRKIDFSRTMKLLCDPFLWLSKIIFFVFLRWEEKIYFHTNKRNRNKSEGATWRGELRCCCLWSWHTRNTKVHVTNVHVKETPTPAADNWNCNFLCFVFLYFTFLRRWLTLIEIFFIYSLPRKAE